MLRMLRTWVRDESPPKLSLYGGLLERTMDQELLRTTLTTNANTLRQQAPYAYFFAGGFSPSERLSHSQGIGSGFLSQFERKELARAVCFAYPAYDDVLTTPAATVYAIGTGDIWPSINYLDNDFFSLLFLPAPVSLEWIAEAVARSATDMEALQALLADVGFVLSIVDYIDFSIRTYDSQYAQYFSADVDEVAADS